MTQANLQSFLLRERFVDKNAWQHCVFYHYQADTSASHGIPTKHNFDRDGNDFFTKA